MLCPANKLFWCTPYHTWEQRVLYDVFSVLIKSQGRLLLPFMCQCGQGLGHGRSARSVWGAGVQPHTLQGCDGGLCTGH